MVTATAQLTLRPIARPMAHINRNITIVISVLLLHLLALWALQSGLLHRVAQAIVPAEILVVIMAAPIAAPVPSPSPSPVPQTKVQAKVPAPQSVQPQQSALTPVTTPQLSPAPLAIAPSATAPAATSAAPTAVAVTPAGIGAGTAVNALAAPARLELPSTNADYLNNPKPPYPALSKRLGEQGSVVIHVLISVDGVASQATIKRSSGFDRLDQAAIATVLKLRYVPGKRAGVPEAMWFDVPINWTLN